MFILLSGDIEANPGPNAINPCSWKLNSITGNGFCGPWWVVQWFCWSVVSSGFLVWSVVFLFGGQWSRVCGASLQIEMVCRWCGLWSIFCGQCIDKCEWCYTKFRGLSCFLPDKRKHIISRLVYIKVVRFLPLKMIWAIDFLLFPWLPDLKWRCQTSKLTPSVGFQRWFSSSLLCWSGFLDCGMNLKGLHCCLKEGSFAEMSLQSAQYWKTCMTFTGLF